MAIEGYATFLEGLERLDSDPFTLSGTVVANRLYDLYRGVTPAPAIPTQAACTRDTAGAINATIPNGADGILSLLGARVALGGSQAGTLLLVDRLAHTGDLDGTLDTAQTTNLPTPALTRYESGEGVMMALTIYTAIGATATTVTVSYTNSAGVAGRTSPAITIGGTGFNAANRCLLIPLQAGDAGVESVTLAATTGTIGSFGVTLFRPLAAIPVNQIDPLACDIVSGNFVGGIPEVLDDACITAMGWFTGTSALTTGALMMAEG